MTANPPNDDFEASWIALEQVGGSGIVQIGFEHDWASPTSSHYCRFFATGDGVAHDYDCGSAFQIDGDYVFFRITQYALPGGINYDVADCGKGGDFSSCTQKDGSQAVYANGAFAAAIQETPHACLSQILGSNPNPVSFGNNSWGAVSMSSSGQWDTRTWTDGSAGTSCPNNYNSSISGDIITSWDSRNTS